MRKYCKHENQSDTCAHRQRNARDACKLFSLKVDCKETEHNTCIILTKKQSNSFILVRTPRNDLKPFTKRIVYSYAVQLTLTKLSAYGASSSPISSFITRYDLQRELYKRLYRYSLFINHKWYYS